MRKLLIILLASFLLSACGFKGPLYSPDKDTAALTVTSFETGRIS